MQGREVDTKASSGNTPLHTAARYGSNKIMRVLLGRGAKVNATNTAGLTPLHRACCRLTPAVEIAVDLLLRWGASETIVDNNGETPAAVLQRRANRPRCSADEAERVQVLLMRTPADRAWRRRGWLVIIRARVEKERIAQCEGSSSGEVRQCGSGLHGGGEDGGTNKVGRTDDGGGSGGRARVGGGDAVVAAARGAAAEEAGLSGLVATLMGLESDGIFRTIVGYL